MVSTRNHPKNFPPPTDSSPTKSTSSASESGGPSGAMATAAGPRKRRSGPNRRLAKGWVHAPSRLTLGWLALSLPLVIWDTGYMLGRPATMPGGWAHSPIWKPYALYGTVDYVYGWPAWEARDGWSGAQGWLNLVETAMYIAYLWIVGTNGVDEAGTKGRGAAAVFGRLASATSVEGSAAGTAVLIGFTAAVMTLSKTVLYWLREGLSGWQGVGHNDAWTLTVLWIIPNGPWIFLSAYMAYVFGAEILDGLAMAAGDESPAPRLAIKDE